MKGAKLQRLTQMRFDIGETFQNCLFTGSTRIDDRSITLFFDDNPKKSIKICLEPVEMLDLSTAEVLTVQINNGKKYFFEKPTD